MWLNDLRIAFRSLFKSPAFTVTVVLILALAIGANTAIFSVVNAVLVRSLPYPEPERLVSLWPESSIARGCFVILKERSRAYENLMGYSLDSKVSLTGQGEPERLDAVYVTADFFAVLGSRAAFGRTFETGDDQPGRDRLAVVSHDFFQRRFGADPAVVGKTLTFDGVERTVVGVMPPGFSFPNGRIDVWVPALIDPNDFALHWASGYVKLVGRLAPGVPAERAQAEFRELMPELRAAIPWPMPDAYGQDATAVELRELIVGGVRPILLVLMAAVGLVLLIACVNVANLGLVRARSRRREITVRAALGAGRGRLTRQLLTESLSLSLLGGAAGFLLGAAGLALLRSRLPEGIPRLNEIGLDLRVAGFTLLVSLLTGVVIGLLPALRASRPDLQAALKEDSRGGGSARNSRRFMGLLVAFEVAATLVLAIGAGLLVRSFWQRLQSPPGFQTENVLSASLAPPDFRYDTDAKRRVLYGEILDRLQALPDVSQAGLTSQMPFADEIFGAVFEIDGRPIQGSDWPLADAMATVSPGYLQTLGVPLVRGRWLSPQDRDGAGEVVLISEGLARRYWPDGDAVGARLRIPGRPVWHTVVGVVADVKLSQLTEEARTSLYFPMLQAPVGPMSVVIRTRSNPDRVVDALQQVVVQSDPDTPVSAIQPLDGLIARSLSQPRFTMGLLFGFAALALLLALLGIYGVTAYAVTQRNREIALRVALGASSSQVVWLVLRQGLVLAVAGVVIGIPLALFSTRYLADLLYGVGTADPATFAAVGLLLAAAVAIASYLPARRALALDPILELRTE